MAAISIKMSSLFSCVRFNVVSVFLLFALCRFSSSALANNEPSSSPDEPLEPGFLFQKLMQQYSKVKTPLILCSLSSSLNAEEPVPDANHNKGSLSTLKSSVLTQCQTKDTSFDSLSVNSLIDGKISGKVAAKCSPPRHGGGTGLARCLSKDGFIDKILGSFMEGLTPGILRMCCLLEGCGFAADGAGSAPGEAGGARGANECLGCLSIDTGKGGYNTKIASSDQAYLLHSLSKMFCSDRKYDNIPCTKLNLVALNVMTGTAPKTILEGAADILRHCYPTFASESLRLFQMIVGNLSANDTSRIKALLTSPQSQEVKPSSVMQFLSGESSVKRERMSDLTARAKTGLVVMGVLLAISILLGAWVVYQRARVYLHPNEAVRYSQININDIYIDDPSREEDDEDDDGDPGEGVPTPYRP